MHTVLTWAFADGARPAPAAITGLTRVLRKPVTPGGYWHAGGYWGVVVCVTEALSEVPAASVPDEAWLLDVREYDEWAAGHVPDATHVPLRQLGAHTAEIPQDQPIYVICRSGVRSARAALALNSAGWQAVNVAGGMEDWAAAGRPMVSDSGAEPFVA